MRIDIYKAGMALLFFVFMCAISPMTSPATAQGADQDPWFEERDAGLAPDFSQMSDTNQAPPSNVLVGVQLTEPPSPVLDAGVSARWFTRNWPAHWHVIWTVMPTSVSSGEAQISWSVEVERAPNDLVTYWITVTNISRALVNYEIRYAILIP